jgi:hypothetical protein
VDRKACWILAAKRHGQLAAEEEFCEMKIPRAPSSNAQEARGGLSMYHVLKVETLAYR